MFIRLGGVRCSSLLLAPLRSLSDPPPIPLRSRSDPPPVIGNKLMGNEVLVHKLRKTLRKLMVFKIGSLTLVVTTISLYLYRVVGIVPIIMHNKYQSDITYESNKKFIKKK